MKGVIGTFGVLGLSGDLAGWRLNLFEWFIPGFGFTSGLGLRVWGED